MRLNEGHLLSVRRRKAHISAHTMLVIVQRLQDGSGAATKADIYALGGVKPPQKASVKSDEVQTLDHTASPQVSTTPPIRLTITRPPSNCSNAFRKSKLMQAGSLKT